MKGKIQLWKNDGQTSDGYPVKLILSHQNKRKRKKIFSIQEKDWDILKQLPKSSAPDFENKYDLVLSIKYKLQELNFKKCNDFDQAIEYLLNIEVIKNKSFYSYFKKRIDFMVDHNRYGNAKVYEETMIDLKKFCTVLEFDEIDFQFLNNYKLYKKKQGLKNTSIKKNLVTIRAVYNSAIKEGVIDLKNPFLGLFADLPVQKRRAKNYYLAPEQLKILENIETKYITYQRAIDLSLLQFYLGGADLIDVCALKNTDIENGRVFMKRRKNGERAYTYDLKLIPKAEVLISKYNTGSTFIFPWFKNSHASHKVFRDNHGRDLKKMQRLHDIKLMPKNENLTSKVMRHTFATLAKFKHYDEDLIREVMGHERNDIDTIYKDKYPEAERDAMQEDITSLNL